MEIISSRRNSADEHVVSFNTAIRQLEQADIQKPKTKNDYLNELLVIYSDYKEVKKRKVENWNRYIKTYCIPNGIPKAEWKESQHVEAFKKTKQYIKTETKDTLWKHFMYCKTEDMAFVVSSARSRLADGLNVSSWMLTCTKNKHMV